MSSDWSIDFFCPADAQGVTDLYRSIYGANYHVKSVYNPEELIAQQNSGETYRAVARAANGKIIGHTAFTLSSPPNRELYEAVQLLVDHKWRGTDLASQLTQFAIDEIPCKYKLKQTWGEAVCNHLFSQRIYLQNHYIETGMELDLLPGASMAQSMKSVDTGRVSVVSIFRSYEARPQTIYVPPVYQEQLAFLYDGFEFGHTFVTNDKPLPDGKATLGKLDLYPEVSVARMTFFDLGSDFDICLKEYDHKCTDAGIVVYQVFLPLCLPSIGAAVDILRRKGYFLGSIMPRWYGDDGLLLQKLTIPSNIGRMKIFSSRSREILTMIQADQQAVSTV